MRGYWLDGTTERKLIKHRKFETSITRPGITLFFKATRTNNYHKNSDKRISARKRNRYTVFTKRLGNVFDEPDSKTYLPAHFLTYSAQKTNYLFPLINNSNTEINDLADRKNDSSPDTNDFAEWRCDSAAVAHDFADVAHDFADVANDFAELENDPAELKNDFAAATNDFAEVRNDFAEGKNDFADRIKSLFLIINEVFRVKHAVLAGSNDTTIFLWLKPIFDIPTNPHPKGTWLCNCKFCRVQVSRIKKKIQPKANKYD